MNITLKIPACGDFKIVCQLEHNAPDYKQQSTTTLVAKGETKAKAISNMQAEVNDLIAQLERSKKKLKGL